MSVLRFSATEMFGIPLDSPESLSEQTAEGLMSAYDIESQGVPTDRTDITPYYWTNNDFLYFLSQPDPEGPAIVDLLPKEVGVDNYLTSVVDDRLIVISGIRRIEIPTQEKSMVIVGGSPRFKGMLCLHELIVSV